MIDIEKLLNGTHITVRCYKHFSFRNMCTIKSCKCIDCKGCPNTNYYIKIKNSKYRLPNPVQRILRKIWD